MTGDTARANPPGTVAFVEAAAVNPTRPAPILASLRDAQSVVGEELRLLRAKVQGIAKARNLTCIALTSALPGEGKSTLSLGLAAALARDPGRRVLLVEADVRRPTLSATLGLPPAAGLSEWLNGGIAHVPVRRIASGGLFLLVAGRASLDRPESLGSGSMDALLRSARMGFDYVIVDATPILPVADAILMQDLLDGYVLVVRSRATPKDAILDALGRLRPDKILGLVLNDHREYRHSYSRYAYERYGMAYGVRPSSAHSRRR
jgi:capsular exopolysaccharide synthesis family protein